MSTTTTAARRRDHVTRADGSPIRALVVDDEPTFGELLSTVLRYEGWQVESACPRSRRLSHLSSRATRTSRSVCG